MTDELFVDSRESMEPKCLCELYMVYTFDYLPLPLETCRFCVRQFIDCPAHQ